MEKRLFFFSSTGVPRKQGAEALGLGLAGLAGSAMSASSASANNRAALAFNKWSQLQAQDYQTQMYNQQRLDQENFYKKYQSPQAIAQALSQLGVNPAVALSGGHGVGAAPPAMPSGMSSPALSAPALENTGEHWAKGLTNITSSIAQLSSASKTNAEAQQILQNMPEVVRHYLLDNENKEIANSYNRLMLSIQEKYGDSKAAQDLTESISRTVVNMSQGNLNDAAAELQKIQKKIADKEFDMKSIDAANYQTQISYLLTKLGLYNDYLREQINTEKTQQSLNRSGVSANYASANYHNALADTEKVNKDIRGLERDILSTDADPKVLEKRVNALVEQWEAHGWISSADGVEARNRFGRAFDTKQRRDSSYVYRTMDNFSDWAKSKLSIFK